MTTELSALLDRLDACAEAKKWARKYKTLRGAWNHCKRSDWMLWLMDESNTPADDQRYRLVACDFAESVLHLVQEGEDRPRKAIEVARRYARGEATAKELAAAGAAARDAAVDASRAAAWAASWDASRAAAWAASWDAARAAAGAAARDAALAASWDASWARQADIIRKYFPKAPEIP